MGSKTSVARVARVARPGRTSLASSEGRGGLHGAYNLGYLVAAPTPSFLRDVPPNSYSMQPRATLGSLDARRTCPGYTNVWAIKWLGYQMVGLLHLLVWQPAYGAGDYGLSGFGTLDGSEAQFEALQIIECVD